jgi:hypothetical protein
MQLNLFESNGAKKSAPEASKHGDPGAAIVYFKHPLLFGPGVAGASERRLDPGGVGTFKWPPDSD